MDTNMLPDNYPDLKIAYHNWLNQGSAPTNGDLVRRYDMDEELLQHLAAFIWVEAHKRAGCSPEGWSPPGTKNLKSRSGPGPYLTPGPIRFIG